MALVLVLILLPIAFFGCGFLCGFLVYRNDQCVSITLPVSSIGGHVETLRGIMLRLDDQLAQHGQRMARGVEELSALDVTSSQTGIVGQLIEANQDFEKQLITAAADVRNVERKLASLGEARDNLSREPAPAPGDQAASEPASDNRRTELRHPFFCRQWIAPYNGVRTPTLEEFFSVQCRDISSGGISFFIDRIPQYDLVVVRLSGSDESKYLTARIQRTSSSGSSEHGRYVLGCKFLGTLHPSALPASLEASIRRREAKAAEVELVAV